MGNLVAGGLAIAAEKSGSTPEPGPDQSEHRDREAAVDIHRLRQIGDIPDIEIAGYDRARQRLEDAGDAAKQRRFAGAVRPDDGEHGAGGDLPGEGVHRRGPGVTQRDVMELQLHRHAHLIASHTAAHRPARTTSAAASRETTGMRRIDQGAACGGCGEARPGPWARPWACAWL